MSDADDIIRQYKEFYDREGEGFVNYHRSYEETEINFVRIEPGEGLPYPLNEEQDNRYFQGVIKGKLNGEDRYFTTSLFSSPGEVMSAAIGLIGEYSEFDVEIESFDIQVIDVSEGLDWE